MLKPDRLPLSVFVTLGAFFVEMGSNMASIGQTLKKVLAIRRSPLDIAALYELWRFAEACGVDPATAQADAIAAAWDRALTIAQACDVTRRKIADGSLT